MRVDVAALLRELDVTATEGATRQSWLLRAPDRTAFELEPAPPTVRLNAVQIRSAASHRSSSAPRLLHVGMTATASVIERAEAGEIDILTSDPIRLIQAGRTYEAPPTPSSRQPPRHAGKPAWIRWALQRYLLTSQAPSRQHVIADTLGSSQQTISRAAKALGSLVTDEGSGLFAPDRTSLLEHWVHEYPGPGGQEFGWYGLDTALENVTAAVNFAAELDIQTLVSGDAAADRIAPWKLPMRGRIYASGLIDLADNGFAPAPLDEANLVICIPRDPTLWRLSARPEVEHDSDEPIIADAAIVYWDLLMSGDQDSEEAAQQLSRLFTGEHR